GSRSGLSAFEWPREIDRTTDIRSVLDQKPKGARSLSAKVVEAIDAWARFTELYPKNEPKPYFPIWAAEFGATYPFATTTPAAIGATKLREYLGWLGAPLSSLRGKAL